MDSCTSPAGLSDPCLAAAAAPAPVRRRRSPFWGLLALVPWLAGLGLPLGAPAHPAGPDAFPRPPELEPDVRFWVRVFTEVDTRGGFVHDNRRLDVVYEVLQPEPEAGPADEKARVAATVDRYREALRSLADGKRADLSAEEERALALWGPETGAEALREAADRVRFQRGQADKFRDGYVRSGLWRDHIETTLKSLGLPVELAALPHVESSYNPGARSHAGAAGLWQFTVPTGKQYLRIDRSTDERLDPFRASEAAARLLRRNHELTGSWPLALTAYNHGAGGVMRAVREMGTDDIVTIVRQYSGPAFGFASRNFYVSFLAALEVDRQAHVHFGPLRRLEPQEAPTAIAAGGVAAGETTWRAVRDVVRPKPTVRQHRVRRGETISDIAARYGVSHRQLMAMNGLRRPDRVQAGQVLRVPAGDS
ncbi:MAG: transglycosylase SLT domain-containing protein [Gammaproteobacteria bacterium]|nr:transglycosylase SLT domain-containing protein [Gammaproteobacteria bacterium]